MHLPAGGASSKLACKATGKYRVWWMELSVHLKAYGSLSLFLSFSLLFPPFSTCCYSPPGLMPITASSSIRRSLESRRTLVSSLSVYSSTLPRLRSIASSQPKMTRSVGVMSEKKKHWKCFFGLINSNAAPDKYNPLLLEMKVDSERKGHICMAQHAINRFGKLSPPSETTTIADKLTHYLLEPNGSAMETHCWKN